MKIRYEYEKFVGRYVKIYTAEGPFLGKLAGMTDNSFILNPYMEEIFDLEGKREVKFENQDFVYSLGFVRGMRPYPEESIRGIFANENRNLGGLLDLEKEKGGKE